jgi:hypothetical protein
VIERDDTGMGVELKELKKLKELKMALSVQHAG